MHILFVIDVYFVKFFNVSVGEVCCFPKFNNHVASYLSP